MLNFLRNFFKHCNNINILYRQSDTQLSEICDAIDNCSPVLVNYQSSKYFGWDSGHWAVVCGYDKDHLYLCNPAKYGRFQKLKKNWFEQRWYDINGKKNTFCASIFVMVA